VGKKPNIILLYSDQQKATSLDVYNRDCTAVEARNLKRLVEQGTLFEHAYCAYPLCVPSRIALMKGMYPSSSGYIGNVPHPPCGEDSLLDRLKAGGYTTYLSGKEHTWSNGNISGRDLPPAVAQRYDHAFIALHNTLQPPEMQEALPEFLPFVLNSKPCRTTWGADIAPWGRDGTITKVLTDKALEMMDHHFEQTPGKPFLLHWSPPDPHEFYQAPKEYADRFPIDEITLPPGWNTDLSDRAGFVQFMRWYFSAGDREPTELDIRKLIQVYLGMCQLIDDEMGRIIDFIEARGEMDNTIFVFTSDHGDMCGELGLAQKWNGLYDGMARIPLVITHGSNVWKRDNRVSCPVSQIDLAATLCDMAGVDAPAGQEGESLVNVMDGSTVRSHVFIESGIPGRSMDMNDARNFPEHKWHEPTIDGAPYDPPHRWTGRCLGVRDDRYKLIVRQGQAEELYDMQEDPWETRNCIDDPALAGKVAELKTRIVQHTMRCFPNFRNGTGDPGNDDRYVPGQSEVFSGPIHTPWEQGIADF
jgi:arylsulfatase A-like enzyme